MRTGKKSELSLAARAIALVVVAAFGIQLGRFYVSINACQHHRKDGNVLQHCQDLPSWISLHRVPLGEFSVATPELGLEPVRVSLPIAAEIPHDILLPPPFHPPRFLS